MDNQAQFLPERINTINAVLSGNISAADAGLCRGSFGPVSNLAKIPAPGEYVATRDGRTYRVWYVEVYPERDVPHAGGLLWRIWVRHAGTTPVAVCAVDE